MAIQNNINQMLGTVAAATTMGKHIANQEEANKLSTISNVGDTTSELNEKVGELNELNKESEGLRNQSDDLSNSERLLSESKEGVENKIINTQDALSKIDPNAPSDRKMKPLLEKHLKTYNNKLNKIDNDIAKNKVAMERLGEKIEANKLTINQTQTQRELLEKKADIINAKAKKYGLNIGKPKTDEELTKEYINSLKGGKR